jgi:F0F1-type ATP synthase membrane subunit b/b'
MKKLKQELEAVSKNLKALALKNEKMVKALDKLEKVPTELKAKAKSAGRAAVEKAKLTATEQVVNIINKAKDRINVATLKAKAKSAGKIVVEKTKLTATELGINIIQKAKDGIDVATLKIKTGFEDTKIRNIFNKTFKGGKIKRAGTPV